MTIVPHTDTVHVVEAAVGHSAVQERDVVVSGHVHVPIQHCAITVPVAACTQGRAGGDGVVVNLHVNTRHLGDFLTTLLTHQHTALKAGLVRMVSL